MIAEFDGLALRTAKISDLPRIDEITIICYTAIHDSWFEMQGKAIYTHLKNSDQTWEERKTKQNRDLFEEYPDWLWVLETPDEIVGFVSFKLYPDHNLGVIENNGILPSFAGRGLGKEMYRHVLHYFRKQGIKVAHVETGLDAPHIPARRAYEAVGFDRSAPVVFYWQDLTEEKAESLPSKTGTG